MVAGGSSEASPISKEEALKRFLARKAAGPRAVESGGSPPPRAVVASGDVNSVGKRKDDHDQRNYDDEPKHREHKKMKQGHRACFQASKKSRFDLVPGFQNTTTKEPMRRPPDMRLVTALASRGTTLAKTLTAMNMGPSGRDTMLQTLTTRDVVLIPDLFEASSGFVLPPDPWEKRDGVKKTIYQRLVEEIHHAGKHEARNFGGKNGQFVDRCFSTDKEGLFKDDANGLFKAWHKTTPQAAGDGLAAGRTGNGHLIVNDRDDRWRQAQRRGEAPMYTAVPPSHPVPRAPCPVRHAAHASCCMPPYRCAVATAGARAHRGVLQDENSGQAVRCVA